MFESSTELACQFFEKEGKPVNRALYPDLVRYYARLRLEDEGYVVENLESENIGKNGLCIVFRQRRIRMWKAASDELPAPGPSASKAGFLNQQLSFRIFGDDDASNATLNLAVLWNANSEYRLERLHLALPEYTRSIWAPATKRWSCEIPNPLLPHAASTRSDDPPPDKPRDLPIRLVGPEAEGQSKTS